jgi:hypothetical protein
VQLMSMAVHTDLESDAGLSSPGVCKKLFLTLGSVHRVDTLVKDAWTVSARGLGNLGKGKLG